MQKQFKSPGKWLPVVMYCMAIFVLSSLEQTPQPLQFVPRTLVHLILYSGLGFFFARFIASIRDFSWLQICIITGVCCLIFGITDEVHQSFVAGRTPQIGDVIADATGGALGAVLYGASTKTSFSSKVAWLLGVAGWMVIGTIIGSHPVFEPNERAISDKLNSYLSRIPVVKLLQKTKIEDHTKEKGVEKAEHEQAKAIPARKPPSSTVSGDQNGQETISSGQLLVTIKNYEGSPTKWGLLVIIDNSVAMAKLENPWNPSRLLVAAKLVDLLSNQMTLGSKIALRDFSKKVTLKRGKKEFPLILSKLVYGWTSSSLRLGLDFAAEKRLPKRTNVCAAATLALTSDFAGLVDVVPRVLLLTDCSRKCFDAEILDVLRRYEPGKKPRIDAIVFGASRHGEEWSSYQNLARRVGGVFLELRQPSDLEPVLKSYATILRVGTIQPVKIAGSTGAFEVLPGELLKLPAGVYRVVLPQIGDPFTPRRVIEGVVVHAGQRRVLEVSP